MNINISFHLILVIGTIIALNLIEVALTLDHRFEDCKPKDCGNGLTIRYPFWIKEDYCGCPGFNVTCKNNEPVLYAAGYDYIIRDIHYDKKSFRVENSVTYGACPVPFTNSTFSDQSPFKLGSEVQALSFFYNCTNFSHNKYDQYIYPVNTSCVKFHRKPFSFAGFAPAVKSVYDDLRCQFSANVPAEVNPSLKTEGVVNGYLPLLKNGFTLEWDKTPCTWCQANGGYCEVDKKGREKCARGIVLFHCCVRNFVLLITF
ncbi:hypothetical protein MKW92_031222 [Papaver armeniacum]|nr:hypothetical protein MKW92_031222 [Papaver armeniacum]